MALPSTLEELVKSFKENTQNVAETEEESVAPLYKLAFSGSLINSMATGVSSTSIDSCPLTFTQLFKSLLLEFLLRQTDPNSATQIQEFGDLPPAVLPSLKKICRFAYNNVKKSKYMFDSDELELDNDLGLVQPVKIPAIFGPKVMYSFLHQCLQEFLAALYLADLSSKQQVVAVREYVGRRVSTFIVPAFAGITKLNNLEVLKIFLTIPEAVKEDFPSFHIPGETIRAPASPQVLLLLLNCIYESQRGDLCQIIAEWAHHKYGTGSFICYDFSNSQLMPIDCRAVGYFVSKLSSVNMILSFSLCYLSDEDVEILMRPLLNVRRGVRVLFFLNGNRITHIGTASICQVIRSTSLISYLSLQGNWIPPETDIGAALRSLTVSLSRNTSSIILNLRANHITGEHIYYLVLMLAFSKSLIVTLDLSLNALGSKMDLLAASLEWNTFVLKLSLQGCCITKKELLSLGKHLGRNKTLKNLSLCDNPFSVSADLPLFLSLVETSGLIELTVTCSNTIDPNQHSILEHTNAERARAGVEPLKVVYMPPDPAAEKFAKLGPSIIRSCLEEMHSSFLAEQQLNFNFDAKPTANPDNLTSEETDKFLGTGKDTEEFKAFHHVDPTLSELCDAAAVIAHQWRSIGEGLGLTSGHLDAIEANTAGRPNQVQLCLSLVFSSWESGMTSAYTWENFVSVLLKPRFGPGTKEVVARLCEELNKKEETFH